MEWLVSGLAVAGFTLAAVGATRVYLDARGRHARMERHRSVRVSALETLRAELAAAKGLPQEERNEASAAASRQWRATLIAGGLEPWDSEAVTQGREFLAEAMIRDSAVASRGDLALVAIGLTIGLVATLMDIWLL